jgi:hypothetical protein
MLFEYLIFLSEVFFRGVSRLGSLSFFSDNKNSTFLFLDFFPAFLFSITNPFLLFAIMNQLKEAERKATQLVQDARKRKLFERA